MIVPTGTGNVGLDDTGSGAPILLLHGFPHDRSLWAAQLAAAIPGARMLAADLPGFGESDPVAVATLDAWADWTAALLDALGIDRVTLGGLSMGGYLCFAVWRRHPDRVRGLVLADTKAGADSAEARAGRLAMQALVAEGGADAVADRMIAGMVGKTTRATDPAVVAMLQAMMRRASPRAIHDALDALRTRADSTPTLATIDVPTLIICGEEDALTPPAESRTMHAAIPGSRLELLPGAGHASCVEAPARFNALLSEWVAATLRAS
jgi:3-oxoadipate enol-lactonase